MDILAVADNECWIVSDVEIQQEMQYTAYCALVARNQNTLIGIPAL